MGKGKKIALLVSMVLVLAAAAVLNVTLLTKNNATAAANNDGEATSVGSFFTTSKEDRQSTRNYEIAQLNEILNMEGDEYATARANALEQKRKLVDAMETEVLLETLLKAQGFDNVLVSVGATSDNVNVIVGKSELTREDTARIYNIITTETTVTPDYVKIIAI